MTHVKRISTIARPQTVSDRRSFRRFEGGGAMVARVGSTEVEVLDYSVTGLRLPSQLALIAGSLIDIRLIPKDYQRLMEEQAIEIKGQVVRTSEHGTHISFPRITYSAAKFFIHQLAKRSGAKPYLFR